MSRRIGVDSSVVFAWLLGEPIVFERAKAVLLALKSAKMLVPAIWQAEVASVLLVKERQQRIDETFVRESLRRLEELDIDVDIHAATSARDRILPLARRQQLSSYDACYLELAMRERSTLATFNEALREAAYREGVPLFD